MSDLYFNERRWLKLLDGDLQAVRFLSELYRRAGGGEAPTYTLEETTEQITNVDNSSTELTTGVDRQRRQLEDLLRQLEDDNRQQRAQLKKLESRLNDLENHQ